MSSTPLRPGPDGDRDALLAEAGERARRYLDGVAERSVVPPPEALAALDQFDFPLPEKGLDASQVVALLDDVGSPATVTTTGPRYFGFVIGGALPVAVAASWLLAAWDQNVALSVMSPAGALLDRTAVGWVRDLLGLPEETAGSFVSGATMANATCLAAARDGVLTRSGWDAGSLGLVGAPPVQVVVGQEVHTSVSKALGFVGLGRDRVLRLPVDDQGRILAENLPKLESPAIVCLQAGNVNSGASDPFVPLIEWAHSQGAWARGAEVWAVLVSLGRDGVSEIVARHVALAKRFAAGLSAGGARVLNDIRLNQVVVSFGDSSTTDAVVAAVQRGGTCWCGPTTWQGHRGMRVSVSNWATTETDVDRSVAAILEAMGQAGSG